LHSDAREFKENYLFGILSMPKPKLLVTGATGFIGYEVSRLLCEGGYRPRLMEPSSVSLDMIRNFDAEFVQGDLTDPQSLRRAVKGMDGLIHLGAKATFESYRSLKPTNLDGSLALMEVAADSGVRTFVFSSSLLVYPSFEAQVDADTPTGPILDYGRIKIEAEKRLSEVATSAGIAFSALRLPHVYGTRSLLFKLLREGRLNLPGSGKCLYTHMHVTDAARALIACAEQGYGETSPIGDDQPASWIEFISIVKTYYPRAKVLFVPQWLALAGTIALMPFRRFRPYSGIETPGAVRSYNCNIAVKPGLVWNDLGITPKHSTIHEGIPTVVRELERLAEKST
jgi:nucleoside-diphosphate-sugar epimerase